MTRVGNAAIARRAARRLVRLRRETHEAIRAILAARVVRCAPKCKGWFIDAERLLPVRCDECAVENRYGAVLHDDDIALLPEAQRAARRAIAEAREAGELVTVDADGGIEFESHAGHGGTCGLVACTLAAE